MNKMLPINKVVESISITHKFDKPVLKFLNTSDVENGKIININHLPIEELKGQAKKTIQKHDILFSEIRPKNRRFAYVDIDDTYDFVVSTKLMVLRKINPEVDNKYFYYFLTNDHMLSILQDRAENRIGSFPQITFDLLSEYFIRVPKLAEQQKIASVLSSLDSKIEINNRINAELEAMAKTLYDYWFVQFDFPNENGKPYKTSGGTLVWNEELKRDIPEGWEVKLLGDLGNFKNGVNYDPSNPGEIACPIINVRNISASSYFLKNEDLDIIYLKESDVRKYAVHEGSIIIARSGIPGATRLISDIAENTLYCGFAIHYELKNLKNKIPIFFFLKSIEQQIQNGSGGTILKNVNQGTLNALLFALPIDNSITMYFNELIQPIFSKINLIQLEKQKLTELRDWLLPMLMNGQVKVN